jgi:hypothetical protein
LKWRREGETGGEERNIKRAKGDKGDFYIGKMEMLDYIRILVGLEELKKNCQAKGGIGFGLCLMR